MASDRSDRATKLKDALVQIGLITIGVLIALSFDGVVAWRQHNALVSEARANLASEMKDNKEELRKNLEAIERGMDHLADAVDVANLASKGASTEGRQVEVAISVAELQSASRSTADLTGAFALMRYDEVKRYTTVYTRQEQYLRLQEESLRNLTRVLASTSLFADPKSGTPREFDDLKRDLRLAAGALYAQRQWGDSLLREYDVALQAH